MNNTWKSVYAQVKEDLMPSPERIDLSWRIALICVMMVCVAMIYEIPFVAVSCFVIFYVMRSDSAESNVLAIALIVLASLVVLLLIVIIKLTLPSPAIRLGVILVSSYFLLFFGVSTQLGPLGGIIALVITFVISILNYVEVPEIATRGTLYAWLMAATPMGIVILANWFWGRRPKNVLFFELEQRLLTCQKVLNQQESIHALREYLGEGMQAQQKRIGWLKLFRLAPKWQVQWAEHATLNIYRLMLAIVAWERLGGLHHRKAQELNRQLAKASYQAAQYVKVGQVVKSLETMPDFSVIENNIENQAAKEIYEALCALMQTDHFSQIKADKIALAAPDIWTNPTYKHHAIKGTAAATICYMLYSIVDWPGIHTAMITCYVASLGSTAETLHKLTLRIVGCLIGAVLGILTLLIVMVHLNDIGSLLVVVFIVSLLSAWVFSGPERISYAGIQIAFAFYLVLLHSFGPSYDFNAAWDRIVGVLLGNVMMYIFFTRVWPVGQQPSVESSLDQAQKLLDQIKQTEEMSRDDLVHLSAQIAAQLASARNSLQMMLFELKTTRPSAEIKQSLERRLVLLRGELDKSMVLIAQAPRKDE